MTLRQSTTAWGHYPVIEASSVQPATNGEAARLPQGVAPRTPRGLGRSYGDSALGPDLLRTARLDLLQSFDAATGILRCEAGVSLETLLLQFVPRGWFLWTTPGTKYVSVGGAIASDVHGKNHHSAGCFSQGVLDLTLLLGDGRILTCSPTEHAELFRATCGGMGLTGLILEARLQLRPIQSAFFEQTFYKAADLDEIMGLFEETRGVAYSVAWIDCLAKGASRGRSLLMVGDHAVEGGLVPHRPPRWGVPFDAPAWLLNPWTLKLGNTAIYRSVLRKRSQSRVHYEPFFYPLDGIRDWNRLYGKPGFTQHQCVLPPASAKKGLLSILERIAASGKGSPLAVLKAMGPANGNPLSFPIEGYTLALDFKIEPGLFELLDDLDRTVHDLGGRLYLSKDARLSEENFKRSYPRWREFQGVREQYGAMGRFASMQSKRLGLEG